MNAFIEFIKEYWFQLATGFFAIIEVVLIVVKRKPKSIDDFKLVLEEALEIVPELVIESENLTKMSNAGSLKKKVVLDRCISFISKKLSRKLTDNETEFIINCVSDKIETVLSTPTKKEKINEE